MMSSSHCMSNHSSSMALAAGAVPGLCVQETLEVEATVPVHLTEATHHHILRDLVTSVLVTGTTLLLWPTESSLRVAVTRFKETNEKQLTKTTMDLWCLQWRGSLISALICVTSSLGSHVLPAWQNYISLKTCLTVDLDSDMTCPRILSAPHTPQPRDTPTWCSSSVPRDRSSCLCHPCHESWHGHYKRRGHPPAVTILKRHTSGSMGHIHKLHTTTQ